jgi:hypothetical protein
MGRPQLAPLAGSEALMGVLDGRLAEPPAGLAPESLELVPYRFRVSVFSSEVATKDVDLLTGS